MEFALDEKTLRLQENLLDFMETHVYPNEQAFVDELDAMENPFAFTSSKILQDLRTSGPRPATAACGTSSCPDPTAQD